MYTLIRLMPLFWQQPQMTKVGCHNPWSDFNPLSISNLSWSPLTCLTTLDEPGKKVPMRKYKKCAAYWVYSQETSILENFNKENII